MRAARGRRGGERGLTLIEMLVTIAIMSIGIAAMVGGLADAERSAAVARSQSALDAALRTASDQLRSAPYVACAGVSPGDAYTVSVPGVSAEAATVLRPDAPPQLSSAAGAVTEASTRCGASGGTLELDGCTPGHGETCDYGIQRVTVTVSSSGRTLSREIWKGAGT